MNNSFTNYMYIHLNVCKHMTDVNLLLRHSKIWNHLAVSKKNELKIVWKMLSTKYVYKSYISCMNRASVFEWHKRFEEGRESVRKSIHQSWLAKGLGLGLGLGLLCWGFKGVQEEIPSEEASILEIGSVAFPPGQCTSPQLHPCHRLFDQDGHQHSSSPSP